MHHTCERNVINALLADLYLEIPGLFGTFLFCFVCYVASPGQPMGESLACFNIIELNMSLR